MQTLKIKPANKDVMVRDPESMKPLKTEGETKPRTTYWLRRIADGDVIDIEVEEQQKADQKRKRQQRRQQKQNDSEKGE